MDQSRRLKILMLIPQLGYGGAEGAFLRIAGYLSRYATITIALMSRDYGDGHYCTAGSQTDLPVVMLDGDRKPATSPLAKTARWWRMLRRLRALKSEHDVAISFLSGANLLNALAGTRVKTIVSERGSKRHDAGMSKRQRLVWTRLLDPTTYRRAQRIVAASEGVAEEITTANPRIADRTIALEGTVHADRLLDHAEATTEGAFEALVQFETIVAFGRLHVQKSFDFLLRVFAEVRRNRPLARLLLIGDGPESARLLALARELGLKTGAAVDAAHVDVIFAGYQENPLRFVRLGGIFVLSSRYEGLPNALIEALAAGIPVLAADCPWGPRSVLSGLDDNPGHGPIDLPRRLAHGTLMPMPNNNDAVEIWSREIAKTLQNPIQRRSREQCRDAIARFDIEVTGPRWLQLIEEMVVCQTERGADPHGAYGRHSVGSTAGSC
jgi:glycosyltransferase involved in cell wall biosynthesis